MRAQQRTRARRRRSRKNQHFTEKDYVIIRQLLHKQWNPEQITGYLKRIGVRCHSPETIYRYIWRDKKKGGLLWTHLRCAQKRRRKSYKAYDSLGRIANKRNIADRPAEVEMRETLGHWEIDTVMGKGSIPVAFHVATFLAAFPHPRSPTTRRLTGLRLLAA
ncbi:MAG: IS30 family transposase [Candidatus Endonucleobacter sp. (ex Gigantidas childressi)]|nr:IS30 family transposase [Candidatus Endonucleobacter sp. (ex Gigantidas childressi)]